MFGSSGVEGKRDRTIISREERRESKRRTGDYGGMGRKVPPVAAG